MTFYIRQLKIRAYRGIEVLDTRAIFPDGMPDEGVVISGDNGAGKTSILGAIQAALGARDIGPDAIREGHERCEILINSDAASVKRVIKAKGASELKVNDGAVRGPADWLATMLGTAAFDVFEILTKDKKKRRNAILGALPVRVTEAQLLEWLEGWKLEEQPRLELHGLEVVETVRAEFFKRRGVENARVKEMTRELEALEAGAPPAIAGAPTVVDADAAHASATATCAELIARAKRVADHEERTRRTRERAAVLRREAETQRTTPAPDTTVGQRIIEQDAAARAELADWDARVLTIEEQIAKLQRELAAAREDAQRARARVDEIHAEAVAHEADLKRHAETLRKADELDAQAAELDAAVAAAAEVAPTTDEVAAADAAVKAAADAQVKARAAALRAEHDEKIAAARVRLGEAGESASKLDRMVAKFTKDVPAMLMANADGVQGLALEGDRIFLDGVDLDKLSGREQLLFAVDIARRLNARAKILIVDGLERVTKGHLREFLERATADGYQLIATRAEEHDVRFDAIGKLTEGT